MRIGTVGTGFITNYILDNIEKQTAFPAMPYIPEMRTVPADLRKNIILKKHIPIMRECFQTIPLILFILHHQIVCIIHRQKVL